MSVQVDLNCDVGEIEGPDGLELDLALFEFISSANVACGGHAGSLERAAVIARACREHGVAFGAHPGYEDRARFGREIVPMYADELTNLIQRQLQVAKHAAAEQSISVSHVKPHGALYNLAAVDEGVARTIVTAVRSVIPRASILGLAGSCLLQSAEQQSVRVIREAFADRRYRDDGTLVPRSKPNAIITDPEAVVSQAVSIVLDKRVQCSSGEWIVVDAESLCLHGDTPGALNLIRQIRRSLEDHGVTIAPRQS